MRAATVTVAGALLAALALAPPARADHQDLTPPEILSASFHGGRTLVLGPNQTLTVQATVIARAPVGITRYGVEVQLFGPGGRVWHNPDLPATCEPINATTSVCTEWFRIDTGSAAITNGHAGDWKMWALVASNNLHTHPESSITTERDLATVKVRRASKLTFAAAPNPVRQGRDVSALGRLTVADWETGAYVGAPGQTAELEFCATPCRTVEPLRTLRTGTYGLTGTTHPATRDGSWWLRYGGTAQYAATYSPGVFVDVLEG
ncbi:hypothetical protein [Streptomyces sp. NPDC018693]|uniref:hypothetical protein n=1 Tax=unclassified Streptomyces TaxID=2593676 RepID=UPI003791AB96